MPVIVPSYTENYFQSLAADKTLHEQLNHLSEIPDESTRNISILSRLIILHFNDLLVDRNEISGKLAEQNSQLESLPEKLCGQCRQKLSITPSDALEVLDNDDNLHQPNLRLSSNENSPLNDLILAPETQAINFQSNNFQNANHATVPETPIQEDLFYDTDEEIIQSSCTGQTEKSPQTITQKNDSQSFIAHSPIIGRTSARNSPYAKADNICKSLKYTEPLKVSSKIKRENNTEVAIKSPIAIDGERVILGNVEVNATIENHDLKKTAKQTSTCSSKINEISPKKESLVKFKNGVDRNSLCNTVPQNRFDSQMSSELDDSNASPSLLNVVSKRNFGRKKVRMCKRNVETSVIDIPSSNNENTPVEHFKSITHEVDARENNISKLGKLSTRNLYNKKSLTNDKSSDSQDWDTEPFQEKSIMFEAAKIVAAKKPIYELKVDRRAVAKKFYKQTTLTESFRKVSSTSMAKGITEAVKRSEETKQLEDIRDAAELVDVRNLPSDEIEKPAKAPNKLLSGSILTESDLLLEINASSSDAHSLVSNNNTKRKGPDERKRRSDSSDNSKNSSKTRNFKIDLSSPSPEVNSNKKRKVLCDRTANSKRVKPVFQPNDSFDVLPAKKSANSPDYPHVGPVVRQKNLRKQLPGFSCKQCAEYYEGENLSHEQLVDKMKKCSRHRTNYPEISNTPEGYWKTGFSTSDSE